MPEVYPDHELVGAVGLEGGRDYHVAARAKFKAGKDLTVIDIRSYEQLQNFDACSNL